MHRVKILQLLYKIANIYNYVYSIQVLFVLRSFQVPNFMFSLNLKFFLSYINLGCNS